MLFAGCCFLIGAGLNAGAHDLAMLVIGRIFLGFGVGSANQVVPLYLSEMAPYKYRGGAAWWEGEGCRVAAPLLALLPLPPGAAAAGAASPWISLPACAFYFLLSSPCRRPQHAVPAGSHPRHPHCPAHQLR